MAHVEGPFTAQASHRLRMACRDVLAAFTAEVALRPHRSFEG